MTLEQQRDREKSEAEKAWALVSVHGLTHIVWKMRHESMRGKSERYCHQAHWSPYVPHVDEWLEEAAEPDEETDSWVARTAAHAIS